MKKILSDAALQSYQQDGFFIYRGFFSPEETALLYRTATTDEITSNAMDFRDTTGKDTKLTLWFTPGDDAFGLMSRSEKLVHSVGQLLGEAPEEVCHFHSKVMQKQPRTGGAWEWHQDYGYWYKNGFLYPEAMLSVMVALTEANQANGCLQVLKGSHKMQRFEHNFVGEQQGADPDFVAEAAKYCELVYCSLQPGDVLFFHSNILHRSDANTSDHSRWSVISAYNLRYNIPFREKHASCIQPIKIVADTALLETGNQQRPEVDFLKKQDEITLHVK
ncbi:phytanoyl-CoA dioxygenase family protein [Flavihumibacter sp. CACIAM 22H1]|uniref:phytanoyl-CoA dioxygenase family protein n=1 Tax=Flavihumibacter sp. CACIAM 22H1 TaxID=1812911 RepID=UPI0007A7D17B|nr:phytanoyl-CoA dioxygenase family protein [Flavihumibacter sp. CACIAM 22H1]KYP13382.1 MAG: proline hydroxylase [Flavihumibacter sp. CACIAM 22H1]